MPACFTFYLGIFSVSLCVSLSIRESQDWAFLKRNKNYTAFIQNATKITSDIFSIWGSWWRKLQQKLHNKNYIKSPPRPWSQCIATCKLQQNYIKSPLRPWSQCISLSILPAASTSPFSHRPWKRMLCAVTSGLTLIDFEDTMEGGSFHCELVAFSVVSPPLKLSFNIVTLYQNHLIAQSYLSMQHVSLLHILSLWSSWTP